VDTLITRTLSLLAAVTLILALAPPAPASAFVSSSAEHEFLQLLNDERTSRGLPALQARSDMTEVSRAWSKRMADDVRLYHNPNFGSQICCWQAVGENVGRGPSVSTIHNALMNSEGHRRNILDTRWTHVSVGVEIDDSGRVWVTQNFRQPKSGSTIPAQATSISGDWDGDGVDSPGWFYDGKWYLTNSNATGASFAIFHFGRAGDRPVVGDWNGNGIDTVGLKRGTTWLLRNSNTGGSANHTFTFGKSTDVPLAGDFNGNGRDTIAAVEGNIWKLRNDLVGGTPHHTFTFGQSSDFKLVGDWNGNGQDTPGLRTGATFKLRNTLTSGTPSMVFDYGSSSNRPVVGDWDGNGTVTPGFTSGIYLWRLRNANSAGAHASAFVYGG
jgi:hypothetical protein